MHGGPAPWNVTQSIYSMFLLNVASTVAARAYWPAKPYHDDVDFPRICEDRQLVAAKCQWLFLHKVISIELTVNCLIVHELPCIWTLLFSSQNACVLAMLRLQQPVHEMLSQTLWLPSFKQSRSKFKVHSYL